MCAICSVKSCTTLVMPPHHPFFFLRTALLAVLQGRPGQLAVVLAIVCASFVSICRATTQRSYLNPMGCAAVLGVQCGNLLASRPGHPFKQACNLISKQWYSTPCSFQVLFLMYWCRMAIIIYLIEAMGGKYIVEQPGSSLLWRHFRLREIARLFAVHSLVPKGLLDFA